MRAYVGGVEIDKIPELAQICAMDDWLGGLLAWAREHRPDMRMDAIFSLEAVSAGDAPLLEVWIGGAPPNRAMEVGGFMRSLKPRPGTTRETLDFPSSRG